MDNGMLRRDLRLSVAEGGLATAMGSLFSGIFLTGFALAMGATRFQIGILCAIPALSGLSQVLGSYWLERFGGSKRLCVACSLLSRLLYLPVLIVPLLNTGWTSETKVWWIIGLMAVSHLLGSLAGVGCLVTWGQDITLGGEAFPALRAVFFLSFLGRLFSLTLLSNIHEPGAATLWQVMGGGSRAQPLAAVPPVLVDLATLRESTRPEHV